MGEERKGKEEEGIMHCSMHPSKGFALKQAILL